MAGGYIYILGSHTGTLYIGVTTLRLRKYFLTVGVIGVAMTPTHREQPSR